MCAICIQTPAQARRGYWLSLEQAAESHWCACQELNPDSLLEQVITLYHLAAAELAFNDTKGF